MTASHSRCAATVALAAALLAGVATTASAAARPAVVAGSPIGVVEGTTFGGTLAEPTAQISGWAFDPDHNAAPLDLDVYVDPGQPGQFGVHFGGVADQPRPDVVTVGGGPDQGYRVTVPLPPGPHQVCTYALNLSGTAGTNVLLGCATVGPPLPPFPPVAPVGALDAITSDFPGSVTVRGWAYDDNSDDVPDFSIPIAVYRGSTQVAVLASTFVRPDLEPLGRGIQHGIAAGFPAPSPGPTTFCVYALGVDNDLNPDGLNTVLGCRTVSIRQSSSPVGYLDLAYGIAPNTLAVSGWTYDPDAPAAPVAVDVYVDPGTSQQRGLRLGTGMARPDLQGLLGIAGSSGFGVQLPASSGQHQVCAFAINQAGSPGTDTLLACASAYVQ